MMGKITQSNGERFTDQEKREMYAGGEYAFNPPPVYTGLWSNRDWMNYIDNNGAWKPSK